MKKLWIIAGVVVVGFILYHQITQIVNTSKSESRLSEAVEKLHKLEIQNKELKKKLAEVNSPQFIENVARDKLGLTRPGETLVVIPEEKIQAVLGSFSRVEEVKLPNWLGWIRVFFR